MSRHTLVACAIAILLAGFAPAAPSQTLPSATPLMETIRGEAPIQLRGLHIEAQVRGGLAQTTVRMQFYNPNPRPLEGNLSFPLLDGQSVTAFALDIDGRLRAAVPVPKAKGQKTFEDVERRRIDPALLEKTQGNNFRLRVFPIPARGTRTVELTYSEALARSGDAREYRLPLQYGGTVEEFELLVETDVAGRPRENKVLGELEFARSGGLYRATVSRHQFRPGGRLDLLLPTSKQPQVSLQARGDELYFVAEVPVPATRVPRTLPRVVGLLWDSSASGAKRDGNAELRELDDYFRALGNGEVRLQRLRDRAETPRRFTIRGGDWSALRKEIEATVYDGASALADWTPQADVGEYLLVSDGLLNYGPLAFPTLRAGQRLYALNSAGSADTGRLRAIAEASGGQLLLVDARAPGAAAKRLLSDGVRVEAMSGAGLAELVREPGESGDGFLRIAGRLQAPDAELSLRLSDAGGTRTLKLPINDRAAANPFAGSLWANWRLAALEASPELQRAEIARIGTRFGIPTSETSLIVLDRVEDYVQYEIAPPAELSEAYAQLKGEAVRKHGLERQEHFDRVVAQFESKLAWWNTDFPKGAPPAPQKDLRKEMAAPGAPAPMSTPEPIATVTVMGAQLNAADVASTGSTAEQSAGMATPANAAPPPPPGQASPSGQASIAMKRWEADAPYMARLKAARTEDLYAIYLDERPGYASSTGFYLDVADVLRERGQNELALRVLSNLAEMDLDNRHILRVLGYRLVQAGAPRLAIPVFEKVLALADYEPQSFRDLGNAYAAAGDDQKAIDTLYEVVTRAWDGRFAEVELIALAELNAIAARAGKRVDSSRLDPRLARNLPLDLRVVLTWDADNSDMDLWVTDPNGEKCFYSNRNTYQGGRMSQDFTGGYGPEEFSLRKAKKGKYKVEVNYFGDRQQSVAGPTTLQMRLSTGFGTNASKDQMVTLRLKDRSESVMVGEFDVN